MLRDPEWVSSEGLAGHFGTGHGQLTDLSDAYMRETQQMQAAILDMLRAYDRQQLSREQQISYDVYEWYLDDQVQGQEFMYHDFPVTHFVTGVQHQLIQLFTDLHPITSRQDAEDYVARLGQVDGKIEGLVEGLQLRANTGIILPSYIFPWLMRDISGIAHGQPRYTPFYSSLEEKLDALEGLSARGAAGPAAGRRARPSKNRSSPALPPWRRRSRRFEPRRRPTRARGSIPTVAPTMTISCATTPRPT